MNAKQELNEIIAQHKAIIKCALIVYGKSYTDKQTKIILPLNYSAVKMKAFQEALNFDYNDVYGGQGLHGTVWLDSGDWLERGEYDGSEWWEYKTCPPIPKECLKTS